MTNDSSFIEQVLSEFKVSEQPPENADFYTTFDKGSEIIAPPRERIAFVEHLANTGIAVIKDKKTAMCVSLSFVKNKIRVPPVNRFSGATREEKTDVWSGALLHEACHLLGNSRKETPETRRYFYLFWTVSLTGIFLLGSFPILFPILMRSNFIAAFLLMAVGICLKIFSDRVRVKRKVIEEMAVEMLASALGIRLGWRSSVNAISFSYVDFWTRSYIKESNRAHYLELAKEVARVRGLKIMNSPVWKQQVAESGGQDEVQMAKPDQIEPEYFGGLARA